MFGFKNLKDILWLKQKSFDFLLLLGVINVMLAPFPN